MLSLLIAIRFLEYLSSDNAARSSSIIFVPSIDTDSHTMIGDGGDGSITDLSFAQKSSGSRMTVATTSPGSNLWDTHCKINAGSVSGMTMLTTNAESGTRMTVAITNTDFGYGKTAATTTSAGSIFQMTTVMRINNRNESGTGWMDGRRVCILDDRDDDGRIQPRDNCSGYEHIRLSNE